LREHGACGAPRLPCRPSLRRRAAPSTMSPFAPSASRSVAAARCKRARLPDAHEEVVGNPERGGAPSSRGGRRSQSVDGVYDTDWEDGISNTVHPLATYRPSDATWAAEIWRVAGGVFLVRGARQLAAVVRWLGRSSGSPASTAAAAGVVVRGRERGHKCWSKRRTGIRRGLVLAPVPRGTLTGRAA